MGIRTKTIFIPRNLYAEKLQRQLANKVFGEKTFFTCSIWILYRLIPCQVECVGIIPMKKSIALSVLLDHT